MYWLYSGYPKFTNLHPAIKGKRPPQALHHINQFRFQYRNVNFLVAEVMAGTFAHNLIWIGRFLSKIRIFERWVVVVIPRHFSVVPLYYTAMSMIRRVVFAFLPHDCTLLFCLFVLLPHVQHQNQNCHAIVRTRGSWLNMLQYLRRHYHLASRLLL